MILTVIPGVGSMRVRTDGRWPSATIVRRRHACKGRSPPSRSTRCWRSPSGKKTLHGENGGRPPSQRPALPSSPPLGDGGGPHRGGSDSGLMPLGVDSADRRHHQPALAHFLRRRACRSIVSSNRIRYGSGTGLPASQLHAATDRPVLMRLATGFSSRRSRAHHPGRPPSQRGSPYRKPPRGLRA